MNFLKRLLFFSSNIKIYIITFIIIFTIVIYIGVTSLASVRNSYLEYSIIANNEIDDGYFFAKTISPSDMMQGNLNNVFKENYELIKNSQLVEYAFTTIVVNAFSYNDSYASIVLYDPELIKIFPLLTKIGITFPLKDNECILSDKLMNTVGKGEIISGELIGSNGNRTAKELIAKSHLTPPYKHLEFGGSGTNLMANAFFKDGAVIIMSLSDTILEEAEKYAVINYYPDVLFSFKEGVSEDEVSAFIGELQERGNVQSLEAIVLNSRNDVSSTFAYVFTKPFIFLITSLFAFFSFIILSLRKKERDISVEFLCGASKMQIVLSISVFFLIVSVVPAAINIAFILMWPELNWSGISIFANTKGLFITKDFIYIVIVYMVLAVIISNLAILLSMSRKSPLQYLKEHE